MECNQCDSFFDEDKMYQFEIPQAICHKCGFIFSKTIVVKYAYDIVYGNGQKTHLFTTVVPYQCPNCETKFNGHEMYCGFTPENTTNEILETISYGTHKRPPKIQIDVPKIFEEAISKLNWE